jgi:hypothetical protein
MKEIVKEIGNEMVKCPFHCEGIINDPKSGIIPRCLFFEEREGKNGAIVVGLNPGHSTKEQREYAIKNNCSYDSTVEFWKNKYWAYFKRTKELLDLLGFDGPIIWTELVKCECLEKQVFSDIPIQTKRTCIDKFLRKEVDRYPKYPIIAAGNEAFEFCSLSFPYNFIIGIPHPSPAHKNAFNDLLKDAKNNKQKYVQFISQQKDSNGYFRAINLKPI